MKKKKVGLIKNWAKIICFARHAIFRVGRQRTARWTFPSRRMEARYCSHRNNVWCAAIMGVMKCSQESNGVAGEEDNYGDGK